MDEKMTNIAKKLYEACEKTNFKVRFGRDHRSLEVDFFKTNNESYQITFNMWFGWREYTYNHEESVGRDITKDEAIDLLKKGFAEYGVVVSEV